MVRLRILLRARTMAASLVVLAFSFPLAVSSAADLPYDGSPSSGRSGFVVVENTWSYRLSEKPEPAASGEWLVNWQLGYLHHLDSRSSLGGSLKVSIDPEGERFGPVVRYRRWLDDSFGVDVEAGAYIFGSEHEAELRLPSPTFELGVTYDDWIGVQAGLDVLHREVSWEGGDHTHVEPYIGVRVGKLLTPVATIALLCFPGLVR